MRKDIHRLAALRPANFRHKARSLLPGLGCILASMMLQQGCGAPPEEPLASDDKAAWLGSSSQQEDAGKEEQEFELAEPLDERCHAQQKSSTLVPFKA